MATKARSIHWLFLTLGLLLFASSVGAQAQTQTQNQNDEQNQSQAQPIDQTKDQPHGTPDSQTPPPAAGSAPEASPAPPNTQQNSNGAPPATTSAPKSSANAEKNGRRSTPDTILYPLTELYSVSLSTDWSATSLNQIPPPAPLSSYAPFSLSGNLVLANPSRAAVLQFATSNNPIIGHDSYWLDTQVHSPPGSGLSLLDLIFYYFFPPSNACMHQVLTTNAPASRASPLEGPAYLQVFYSCPLSDTLSDFYAGQVSAGITFQHTDNGTRVLAPVGDFYVAPMEQVEQSGMTFFVFEAQGMNAISGEAASRFHLPPNAQGGQPDFFWAIGAPSPFPFTDNSAHKNAPILHVAYARIGVDADAKAEFMRILYDVRTTGGTK